MTNIHSSSRAGFPRQALAATLLAAACLPLTAPAQGLRPSGKLGESTLATRPASTTQRTADYIVAVVNSEPITNNELRNRLVRIEQQMTQQGGALPSRETLARQVLERLISEKTQLQVGHEAGIKIDDAAVDQAELNVARQNEMGVPEMRRRLTQDGIALSLFREELRNQLLLTRVREREVEPRVRVSELDIDQFIREQQGSPEASSMEVNLAQVLVAVPEGATDAQIATLQARAARVAERARAGEDFATLAREFSDAPDRDKSGGQFGLRSADRYPGLFIEATQALGAGGIAGPVRSGAGFHVLKVVEKRQANLPGMTVTQSRARHILLRPGAQLSESAARERLADFRRRLLAGQADFASLARENSQDGSAREGGDLGWASPGQFVPEFEDAMNRLAPGQVGEPLVSRFGVHLIQLMERRETTLSPREQREIVRNLVREKKLEEAYTTWAQDVRSRAYVEYREAPQ
jgi:peptidyl-prolyl cis-trans isomerase SurA